MSINSCYEFDLLPDLTAYGGNAEVIEILPVDADGNYLTSEAANACVTTLSVSPLTVLSGLGNNGTPVAPVIVKSGTVEMDSDSHPMFVFNISPSDTKKLRGKYIYQVEVKSSSNSGSTTQIFQGNMYVRLNINQEG